jgi:hypothetical protein
LSTTVPKSAAEIDGAYLPWSVARVCGASGLEVLTVADACLALDAGTVAEEPLPLHPEHTHMIAAASIKIARFFMTLPVLTILRRPV